MSTRDYWQGEVDYWFEVARLYMDDDRKASELSHAMSRLDEAIAKRDTAE